MRLRWTGLRRPELPEGAAARADLAPGETVLAFAPTRAGDLVVATATHLVVLPSDAAASIVRRPWHLVDAGSWDREADLFALTWVDRQPALRLAFDEADELLQAVRERVQASVVLAESVALPERRSARVVVRRDLASGALLSQAVLGRGATMRDPQTAAAVNAGLARVKEQVGL